MGNMGIVVIKTDEWETIKANPEEFVKKISNGLDGFDEVDDKRIHLCENINEFPVGNYCNPIEVSKMFHDSQSKIYYVGQNYTTDLTETDKSRFHLELQLDRIKDAIERLTDAQARIEKKLGE